MALMIALVSGCGSTPGQGSAASATSSPALNDYSAPANLDACKLLTTSDAATILGGKAVVLEYTTRTHCNYGSDNGKFVSLWLNGAASFDLGRKAAKATNTLLEDVSGLGDAAYFQLSGGALTLHFKKSGADVLIFGGDDITNRGPVDHQKAIEKNAAQVALPRM